MAREFEADVRVEEKREVAEGVVMLSLRSVGGHSLPSWTAGAHIDLILPGDAPTRQYSLCGSTVEHTYRIGILRDPNSRGGSSYVYDKLQTGDVIRIRGPRNHFALNDSPRYIFIAGGIGITPILAMITEAQKAGAEWQLVYGGRMRSSMAFLDELAVYGDRVSIQPQDEVGLLDLDSLLDNPQSDTLVYCCGPEPLLAAVEQRCTAWPSGSLHLERFAPKAPAGPITNVTFEVVLAQSDLTLHVPADRPVLDVLEDAGIHILSSCREGTCGTCEVKVLEGEPDHRDSVLTEEEQKANDCMMVCVSRSRSKRLVLDL
ncbi:PDR/VanB family oxidoreductase [Arthrobacter sp. M4]|uniref:PDR/VanB family oxidoreductase n=1 Tax=Arthrobacter sp. M4 TaxID=218160 RepID=UPI001CDBD481|nr:PDR/VanB family oxidoreductase [Arthrobacter sp. M4]MCA4134840.1 PDR/VanB family oxidoreductase [Arthrobacter sp. M4]